MALQETIASQLEHHKKVYVAYYDVAKAFDGVWISGLFFRLRAMGLTGRTWRLLHKCYIDFQSRVRIQNLHSEWYKLECGVHQGGYLSLFKYIAFINTLLTELEESNLCCAIYNIKTSPLGYADDVASACTSKIKLDMAMNIVNEHSNMWRYSLNATKCAVLVFGETKNENCNNAMDRSFKLGKDPVRERKTYDHVGLKNCVCNDYSERVLEKVSKGRKALYSITGLGIKSGGLSMKVCCMIYWTIIIPTVTFASELWVMNDADIEKLDYFQCYVGRRKQRLHSRSPSNSSYETLGWMRLENFINMRKLIFIRSVLCLDDENIYKKIFLSRMRYFISNQDVAIRNEYFSPIFEMMKIAIIYGLYEEVKRMVTHCNTYSKKGWKNIVQDRAWVLEDADWQNRVNIFKICKNLDKVIGAPHYVIWWQIGDSNHKLQKQCEVMVKLLCGASQLKSDDKKLKGTVPSERSCTLCDNFEIEDTNHMVMRCEYHNDTRRAMFYAFDSIPDGLGRYIVDQSNNILSTILGRVCIGINVKSMFPFWIIASKYVSSMYWNVVRQRRGIG